MFLIYVSNCFLFNVLYCIMLMYIEVGLINCFKIGIYIKVYYEGVFIFVCKLYIKLFLVYNNLI